MALLLRFIKTRKFYLHLVIASLSALLILWMGFKYMGIYTDHGETVKVPDFTGKKIKELARFVEDKDVSYIIIDSLFDPKLDPGIVVRQDPEKNEEVKHNRIIYLYVTSTQPPTIEMPKLVDRSLRQAALMIESYGLKLGRTKFVADPCKNCILKQMSAGKEIKPGEQVKKGTVIDLYIGKGQGGEQVSVPNIIGMSFCEAKSKISGNGLSIGAIITDGTIKDTCSAYVYKQSPIGDPDNRVGVGASVDVYISTDKKKVEDTDALFSNDEDEDDQK